MPLYGILVTDGTANKGRNHFSSPKFIKIEFQMEL